MSTQIVGHDFALLPVLLAQAGMTDLIPSAADERGSAPPYAEAAALDAGAPDTGSGCQDQVALAPPEPSRDTHSPAAAADEGIEITRLLTELAAAADILADLRGRDAREREAALKDLERYDAAVAAVEEACRVGRRAAHLRAGAERLARAAFADDVRAEATRIGALAEHAEAQAEQCARTHQARVEALAGDAGIRRALEERRRLEQTQHAAAEAEAWAQRREDALRTARMAATGGWFAEARAALAGVEEENEGDEEIAALVAEIAERAAGARVAAAQAAVLAVRHELHDEPAAAVARLESLDVDGLPHALACHVFNAWSRACLRLCRAQGIMDPLRLSPRQGRGAVLVPRGGSGRYVVFSALGMGAPWEAGRAVDDGLVGHAEPLRRSRGTRR